MKPRPRQTRLRALYLLCCLLVVSPAGAASPSLDTRIELAAAHLLRMQLDSGLFVYEHDFLSGADSGENNIVRQAGAGFALGEYYRYARDPAVARALAHALDAYGRNSVSWRGGRLLALDGDLQQAKAGATALAVLTLLFAGEHAATPVRTALLEEWIESLLALQQPDGGFAARPGSTLQSAYSNGEIWLALAAYVERFGGDGDPRVARALQRADRSFVTHYQRQPDIGFFHWGMMAAALRYSTTRDSAFTEFIAGQTDLYLSELRPRTSRKSNSCYAVEGMLAGAAALEAAGAHDALVAKIHRRVAKEMKKNKTLQLLPGQTRIRFGKNHYLAAPHLARYSGAFLNGRYRPQIRIDATQHCLSAMIKERTLLPRVAKDGSD